MGFYRGVFRYGDVITAVNKVPVEDILKKNWKYISGSNDAAKLRNFYYAVFNGQSDKVEIDYERDGQIYSKKINRYLFTTFHQPKKDSTPPSFKFISDDIGYVNLGLLHRSEMPKMIKEIGHTTAIIMDARNYPNWVVYPLVEYFNRDRRPFAKFFRPDLNNPGEFIYKDMAAAGKKNPDYYKGRVIILCNENTQSQAAFTIMALQTAPDVTVIGSRTAGADGDINRISFPGGYTTYISGLGVEYPDGKQAQRIGIIPDIVIRPTISGIRMKRDEVLEKAVEVAGKQDAI